MRSTRQLSQSDKLAGAFSGVGFVAATLFASAIGGEGLGGLKDVK
jgi:hypothetical protein